MSEQNDLFGNDGEKIDSNDSAPEAKSLGEEFEETVVEQAVAKEELTVSKKIVGEDDFAGRGIATGEVQAVEQPPKRSSGSLLMLLMLVVLLGGGYYLFSEGYFDQAPAVISGQQNQQVKRYAIDKQVRVEVLAQQQVVAAEDLGKTTTKPTAPVKPLVVEQVVTPVPPVKKVKTAAAVVPVKTQTKVENKPLFRVLVGPYLTQSGVEAAAQKLRGLGLTTATTRGRGKVAMTRLLEGVYPQDKARQRLQTVKDHVADAFMLPAGDKWAIYVGSFTDAKRALQYAEKLTGNGLTVTPVVSDVEMNGKMLIAAQSEQPRAKEIAARINAIGLQTQVKK